ncbi:hypothetical protein ACXR2T_10230 [Leucobacter sp. HY1910]
MHEGLIDLGLAEGAPPYDEIAPTDQASKLRLTQGEWYQPSLKWNESILPQLAQVLNTTLATSEDEITRRRIARRRQRDAERRAETKRQQVAAQHHEAELSLLTGPARVLRMIDERKPILQAQYTDDEWREQLAWQTMIASGMQRDHGFEEDYPDFESELWDRIIFTVDEQMVAARRFEAAGRAAPAPARPSADHPRRIHA